MEEQQANTTDPTPEDESTLRPWVTPSFEQTALKDALSGPLGKFNPVDGITLSS